MERSSSPQATRLPEEATKPVEAMAPQLAVENAFVLFGGQGYAYLDELRKANDTAKDGSITARIISAGLSALQQEEPLVDNAGYRVYARYPFSSPWLLDSSIEPQPSDVLLASSPFSYPLIFLTQMANYGHLLDTLKIEHEEMLSRIQGGTGHSQGVMSAFVLSLSPDTDALLANVDRYARCLMWLGLRANIPGALVMENKHQVVKSPMLAVSGVNSGILGKQIEQTVKMMRKQVQAGRTNESSAKDDSPLFYISLINAERACVVSGDASNLVKLKEEIEKRSAPAGSQSRVPFSQRKPEAQCNFLSISSAFHCPFGQKLVDTIVSDWQRIIFADNNCDAICNLSFPVLSTIDGTVSPSVTSGKMLNDVLKTMVEWQCVQPVNWPSIAKEIVSKEASKVVFEFGPSSGAAKMLASEQQGSGLSCIVVRSSEDIAVRSVKASPALNSLKNFLKDQTWRGPNWAVDFRPVIIRNQNGQTSIATRFTEIVGHPPLLMAGMTPTTSLNGVDLVAACMQAGFVGELAGGGLVLADYFRSKVTELTQKAPPGMGVSINLLFLNAHLWGIQFPLVLELARSGVPIQAVTVAAGIPSREKANEIITELANCGIKVVAFKPGTAQGIRDCLSIAEEVSSLGVIIEIQWTGGRGGGHHSFEDFHEPLLETYSAIRSHSNVLLVVGSGFGDGEGSFPYLTGTWSEAFGRPRMPCDAILLGSRCMVAKEASTAKAVKDLIVSTQGVQVEREWERSYTSEAGGIITLTSELGEPIHKIGNRGMVLWREFDRKYFSLAKGPERTAKILKDKDAIIRGLNRDFQKIFFGYKDTPSGRVPCDLEEMTYTQVLGRMIELMFVENGTTPHLPSRRWLDVTYQTRTYIFLSRAEQRFRRAGVNDDRPIVADDIAKLRSEPARVIDEFAQTYPAASETHLTDEDVSFFVTLCRDTRFGKPVNFIPVIDGDLDFWLKKDSLWYSEDLDAVPDRDPQRVCILQGPLAVHFSNTVDEPISDILGGINNTWIKLLEAEASGVETSEHLALPAEDEFSFLASLPKGTWHRLVLASDAKIVRSRKWIPNYIASAFRVVQEEGEAVQLNQTSIKTSQFSLELISPDRIRFLVLYTIPASAETVHIEKMFAFQPNIKEAPLVEMETHTRPLYERIWLAPSSRGSQFSIHDVFTGKVQVTEDSVKAFNEAIEALDPLSDHPFSAPTVDFAIVCGWEPLMRSLFAQELARADLLNLVHLSHGFRILSKPSSESKGSALRRGDVVFSKVRVTLIEIVAGLGKKVTCVGTLSKTSSDASSDETEPWLEITSSFLIRGNFDDYTSCFSIGPARGEEQFSLTLETQADCAVLASKSWLRIDPAFGEHVLKPGTKLRVHLDNVQERRATATTYAEIRVQGAVFLENDRSRALGVIDYHSTSSFLRENPVLSYLRRKKTSDGNQGRLLESGGATLLATPEIFTAPKHPEKFTYGPASGDVNPIHYSRYIAALAALPESRPIVHGMWTFAKARQIVSRGAAEGKDHLVHKMDADFVGMVRFGERLAAQLTLLGVITGRKLVRIELRSVDRNELVFRAKCEVEQPKTAFLFTGQGSASVGMGMDRYEEKESVRNVWDRADAHLLAKYGFSLLKIVRENPKELTVHFGGSAGRKIRDNFRAIRISNPATAQLEQLLPEIDGDTKSFTFRSAGEGLLFATQFAQPALVMVQKAAFHELVDDGLVPTQSCFAGHSLGEYAGLAAFADVLSIEDLVETVFLRGMVMQNAVKRDANGRSAYAMVAVNPGRVKVAQGSTEEKVPVGFSADDLQDFVDSLSEMSGVLLQVVNFNVRGSQYVVAGHLIALDALEQCLSSGSPRSTMATAITRARERYAQCKANNVPFELVRGPATIPLPGIDVPFHSRELVAGVPAFKELLEPRLPLDRIVRVLDRLVGKYIPNVTAKFFSVDVTYVELSAKATNSKVLKELASNMRNPETSSKLHKAIIARTLLLELLAHQFAMPVLWIDTQDLMFRDGTRRFIEMGPAPTLVGMLQRTLASGYRVEPTPQILWWNRDMATITYAASENHGPTLDSFIADIQQKEAAAAKSDDGDSQQSAAVIETKSIPVAPVPVAQVVHLAPAARPVAPAPSSGGGIVDHATSAKHTLRVLLATKLKRPIADMTDSATLKSLAQGKSAMQNELVGDIGSEFNLSGDALSPDATLTEIAAKAQPQYKQLGKVATQLVSRTLAAKLPGAFPASSARNYLTSTYRFSAGTVESALLHACLSAPSSRLGDETSAKQWLDGAADSFAKDAGISLSAGASSSSDDVHVVYEQSGAASGGAGPIPDASPTPANVLQVLIASKLRVPPSDVRLDASLKSLAQGKSALQNELVGDLQVEFPTVGDWSGLADVPLNDVAKKLVGSYQQLGKVSTQLVSRTLAAKLPGAFPASTAREYLASKGLGPNMTESVLLNACAMAPGSRLGSADDAKKWLDSALESFARSTGVDLSSSKRVSSSGGSRGGVAVSSEALKAHQKRLNALFESQADALKKYFATEGVQQESSLATEAAQDLALVDLLRQELGDQFMEGVRPCHDPNKVREYDSYWNWVNQDALDMHLHVFATLRRERGEKDVRIPNAHNLHFKAMAAWISSVTKGNVDEQPPEAWFRNYLCNRATQELLQLVESSAASMQTLGFHEYAQIVSLLAEQVEAWVKLSPVLVVRALHDAPRTIITPQGKIQYEEVKRDSVVDCAKYVESLANGKVVYSKEDVTFDPSLVPTPAQVVTLEGQDVALIDADDAEGDAPFFDARTMPRSGAQSTSPKASNFPAPSPTNATRRPQGPLLVAMRDTVVRHGADVALELDSPPLVHLRKVSPNSTNREHDPVLTAQYLSCMHALATRGVSFAGQVVLVTGAGAGSIAIEIVKLLLEGGAVVISALNYAKSPEAIQETIDLYRRIYEEHGSKGSRLITEPFNAASSQDVAKLVDHIYSTLHLDLDFIIPFAALPERGRDISRIDAESELSHRAMLTNVIRLLGKVRDAKSSRGITTRPAMVLMPCSPNHGVFGNDGLYAESKLGLESLVHKWKSEGWSDYLTLGACVIGWTRSALMWQNNVVAEGVERLGVRTFSTSEMAVNIVALMHPRMVTLASEEPLWADMTGGWEKVQGLDRAVKQIREEIQQRALIAQMLNRERSNEPDAIVSRKSPSSTNEDADRAFLARADIPSADIPLCNFQPPFPPLPSYGSLQPLGLTGMVDLEKVVCIVGYGEVGPWGGARTRWEMEAYGHFSLEGCVELAWLVGLIEHFDGPLPTNPRVKYVGWVDTKTKEPVMDHEVKRRYEATILAHSGVRIVEPELFEGYNPKNKLVWTKVGFDKDLPIIEAASREQALQIQSAAGGPDKCELFERPDGTIGLRLRAGAVLGVPRAFQFNRFVAGQIPTGWSAERLGVPPEIARAVDPVTLYALVSTMEAFVSAGVCDPYELYTYVHLTQVGNTSGGGMGGMRSLKRMFGDRLLDDPEVPSDTLAESFINTMPAWVNMLLVSSAGPIKTPVGACATAAESVEIGVETILSGKARVVIVGGYDDFGETGAYEFAQMGATQDNEKDAAKGRLPREASRPMTSSRSGFVESHGAGMQLLMDAKLALEMGCPIFGIVALTNTATDREGRSVPAPGKGILTTARERKDPELPVKDQAFNLEFRRKQLQLELAAVEKWEKEALESASEESQVGWVKAFTNKKRAAAWETWGQGFYKNLSPDISPLAGALAVWGLTVDNINVVSCHGTSTLLNDKNESSVVQKQFEHLGRSRGNMCLVVAQKWLTAHPKGAAAAWMLNGALQILATGVVPGNRNLDNCAEELRQFDFLIYPNRSIELPQVDSILLKSFGFGQAGAEILIVHPDRLLATLSEEELQAYATRRARRRERTHRYWQGVFSGKHKLIQVKNRAPFLPDQEAEIYLDPTARAKYDPAIGTYVFPLEPSLHSTRTHAGSVSGVLASAPSTTTSASAQPRSLVPAEKRLEVTLQEQAEGLANKGLDQMTTGVGVDVEPVSTFVDYADPSKAGFMARNFTPREIQHCSIAANPAVSFAGRWAAKEACIKALSSMSPTARSLWEGAHGALIEIEVVSSASGAPLIELHGHAKQVALAQGVGELKVSISHTGDVAVAQALATMASKPV